MGNLFGALLSSTNSLRSLNHALGVVQNNVANASTPGYAKQVQSLVSDSFIPEQGLMGGMHAGDVISRRSEYLESAVRQQQSAIGYSDQRMASLTQIEPLFSPIENAGVAGALSSLYQSLTQASVTPNSTAVRQTVLDRAEGVARSFNETADGIQSARAETDRQAKATVDDINNLLDRIRELNVARQANAEAATDAGADANLHQALEDLSELADIQVITNSDRSLTVLLGGAEPVVVGDHVFPIGATFREDGVSITNAQGGDITVTLGGGRLGALVELRNDTLPSYLEQLDTLAASFGERVNSILGQGLDQTGVTPARNLFTWDSSHAAMTLKVTSDFIPADLALARAPSDGGNGNALELAALANEKVLDGGTLTFTEYFGNLGGQVGRELNDATEMRETQASLLTQARNLREEKQGVSLDEEAAVLMSLQKGYEACAQLIKVLDELTDTTIGLLR
jgi:flagellar hook-associated protein 1 FlgK